MKVQTYLCSLTLYISYLHLSPEPAHPVNIWQNGHWLASRSAFYTCLCDSNTPNTYPSFLHREHRWSWSESCEESGKSATEQVTCQLNYKHILDNSFYLVNSVFTCSVFPLTRSRNFCLVEYYGKQRSKSVCAKVTYVLDCLIVSSSPHARSVL